MEYLVVALEKTDLVSNIAQRLGISVIYPNITQFADGEYNVSFDNSSLLKGKHIVCILSGTQSINDQILVSAFCIQAIKQADAAKVTGILPYMGYARNATHGVLIATLFEQAGLDAVMTIALHDLSLLDCFSIATYNIPLDELVAPEIKKNLQSPHDTCFIAPDAGAQACVMALSSKFETGVLVFSKKRSAGDYVRIVNVDGFCSGITGVVVDDMITTGGTLLALCEPLKERGYKDLIGYCGHAVLAGDAVKRIEESSFTKLYVSNTIPLSRDAQQSFKLAVFDVSKIVVSYLDEYVL